MKLPGEERGFLRLREAEDGTDGGEVTASTPTVGDLLLAPAKHPRGQAGGWHKHAWAQTHYEQAGEATGKGPGLSVA